MKRLYVNLEVLKCYSQPRCVWDVKKELGSLWNTVRETTKRLEKLGLIRYLGEVPSSTKTMPKQMYQITERGRIILQWFWEVS